MSVRYRLLLPPLRVAVQTAAPAQQRFARIETQDTVANKRIAPSVVVYTKSVLTLIVSERGDKQQIEDKTLAYLAETRQCRSMLLVSAQRTLHEGSAAGASGKFPISIAT